MVSEVEAALLYAWRIMGMSEEIFLVNTLKS
jgi:hypothetical protein